MTTTWKIWIDKESLKGTGMTRTDAEEIGKQLDTLFRTAYIFRMGKVPPNYITTVQSDEL